MHLFNPQIIEDVLPARKIIPDEHKKILDMWGEYIDSGDIASQNETELYESFSSSILQNILQYKVLAENPKKYTLAQNLSIGSGSVEYALGHFGEKGSVHVIAPLELKSPNLNLDAPMPGRNKTPVRQAWEYAMDAKGAKWVIVSNYVEIRLYAVGYGTRDYERFNLLSLRDPKEYLRFVLLLSSDNLLGTRTLDLLTEGEKESIKITNEFYLEYKKLRERLIVALQKDNPKLSTREIIQFSQSILDKVLFVAFAEDKALLPDKTIEEACKSPAFNPTPIWDNFKGLFRKIDVGDPQRSIPAYNGGLFREDSRLETIVVNDSVCKMFEDLSKYNFRSEVSVNILGHILEQSITDVEELQKKYENKAKIDLEEERSERKKQGVFYTPSMITRYIVDKSVGGWLADKKKEIGFDKLPVLTKKDYDSLRVKKTSGLLVHNANIKKHLEAWEKYKEALSNIKVLDPACGSGAFLIEVFDFLYREGELVNAALQSLRGGKQIDLLKWDKHILNNNLYGVDINYEAVEITKLSLWLKTANKNEKLTYLDNNIKSGDALIDDSAVIGDLAFDWDAQYYSIMKDGGFDVIVGNPPYGADIDKFIQHLKEKYPSTTKSYKDIYKLFFERSLKYLLKPNGYLCFISPNTLMFQPRYEDLRNFLLQYEIKALINLGMDVFEAAEVPTCITLIHKTSSMNSSVEYKDLSLKGKFIGNLEFSDSEFINQENYFKTPLHIFTVMLKDFPADKYYMFNDVFESKDGGIKYQRKGVGLSKKGKGENDLAERIFYSGKRKNKKDIEFITGSEISKDGWYVDESKVTFMRHDYKDLLKKNEIVYYSQRLFDATPKIVWRQTSSVFVGSILKSNLSFANTIQAGYLREDFSEEFCLEYILCLLMSEYLRFLYSSMVKEGGRLFPQVKLTKLKQLPIRKADQKTQKQFIALANTMLQSVSELEGVARDFLDLVSNDLKITKFSKKLLKWYELEPDQFLDELKKRKVKLGLKEKQEWVKYFDTQKRKASKLSNTLKETYEQINNLVYLLYEVSDSERSSIQSDSI